MTLKLVQLAARALEAFYTTVGNALDNAIWALMSPEAREDEREYPGG